jgi:chorismate dehydratase
MQPKYSVSIVNYLNTLPFKYGIEHSPVKNMLELSFDIPSVCAEKLKKNEVDIGLVPVALLPELNNYHLLGNYCIGADGKVDSVKLYSEVPLNEIKVILLDHQSKTSVNLVQLLAKKLWHIHPEFVPAEQGFETKIKDDVAAVIIGDRTFGKNGLYEFEYDLSEEWKKLTGLPFVFAAWVSRNPVDHSFVHQFDAALEYGLLHIDEALNSYTNQVPGFDPSDYIKNKISYHLDEKKRKALATFLSYLSA